MLNFDNQLRIDVDETKVSGNYPKKSFSKNLATSKVKRKADEQMAQQIRKND